MRCPSVQRAHVQALFIACGGAAAEYQLQQTGRLFSKTGRPADTTFFLSEATQNAVEDVKTYMNAADTLGIAINGSAGDELLGIALAKVHPRIDFAAVEKIALALLDRRQLSEGDILDVLGPAPSPFRAAY